MSASSASAAASTSPGRGTGRACAARDARVRADDQEEEHMAVPVIPIAIGAVATAAWAAWRWRRRRSRSNHYKKTQTTSHSATSSEPADAPHRSSGSMWSHASTTPCKYHQRCLMFQKDWKNLYVVRLRKEIWRQSSAFRERNRGYEPSTGNPCVYVGYTAHDPSCRVDQLHNDYKATGSRYVQRFSDHYPPSDACLITADEYNPERAFQDPVRDDEAEQLKVDLAQELQAKGWAVWWNVKDVPGYSWN